MAVKYFIELDTKGKTNFKFPGVVKTRKRIEYKDGKTRHYIEHEFISAN